MELNWRSIDVFGSLIKWERAQGNSMPDVFVDCPYSAGCFFGAVRNMHLLSPLYSKMKKKEVFGMLKHTAFQNKNK